VQNKVWTDKLYEPETLCPEGFLEHAGSKTGFARASIDGRLFEETGRTCYIYIYIRQHAHHVYSQQTRRTICIADCVEGLGVKRLVWQLASKVIQSLC
jgi:hypothetical protein